PITDSVRIHQWLTWAMNPSLSGFRQPFMSVALGFMCVGTERSIFLTASDDNWDFPQSDSWMRYRVDQNTASTWQQGKGVIKGRFMIVWLDSSQSSGLLKQIISGRERIVMRVRAGLKG